MLPGRSEDIAKVVFTLITGLQFLIRENLLLVGRMGGVCVVFKLYRLWFHFSRSGIVCGKALQKFGGRKR